MTLPTHNDSVYNEIKALSLFQESTTHFIKGLAGQSQVLSLEKGQVLCLHEDKADRFFIVSKGWVKLFRETMDGTQVVLDVLTEGQMFGEVAIFQDDLCAYSAEAAENAEVISLPLSLLKKEIEENPDMVKVMMTLMARFRQQQDREIEHRTIKNAPQRIGCFLLRLVLAQKPLKDSASIQLPYDKTLLASRLGMQPETFSRALKKLKSETNIEIKGGVVEVSNLEKLTQYSCAACSSEFPCQDIKATS